MVRGLDAVPHNATRSQGSTQERPQLEARWMQLNISRTRSRSTCRGGGM